MHYSGRLLRVRRLILSGARPFSHRILAGAVALSMLAACTDAGQRLPTGVTAAQPAAVDTTLAPDGPINVTVRTRTIPTAMRRGANAVYTDSSTARVRSISSTNGEFLEMPAVGMWAMAIAQAKRQGLSTQDISAMVAASSLRIAERALGTSTLCANERRWVEKDTLPDGVVYTAEGIGDAPARKIEFTRNGAVESTIESSWERKHSAWQLLRRVTTIPAKGIQEELVFERSVRGGGSRNNVLRVACAQSPPATAAPGVRRFASRIPGSASTVDANLDIGGDCGKCEEERRQLSNARYAANLAAITVLAACAIPEPYQVVACALAVAGLKVAIDNLQEKERALAKCIATPGYQQERIMSGSGVASGVSLDVDACSDSPGSGGGGGSGGAGGFSCHFEQWEISYDGGNTWEPITVSVCGMS